MPNRLHRYHGAGYSHFITTSCYRRLPLLGSPRNRDLFLRVLELVRRRYRFAVTGYVVMPEHVHLLISEPQRGDPSLVMKALKQGFARRLLGRLRRVKNVKRSNQMSPWQEPVERGRIWQCRFYDFVVFSGTEAGGEVALHPSQSRETRTGSGAATVEVEQFPPLCLP